MLIAGKTDIGRKRSGNEDSFHAEKINDIHIAVVCDGVGGARAGNVASSVAVSSFVETFKELFISSTSPKSAKSADNVNNINNINNIRVDYKNILIASVAKANDNVFSASREDKNLRGMGTTMVACIFDESQNEYYAVNVGDSRLYIIDDKNNQLNQITRDHSLVQDLIESGALTKEQAEKSPNKNIITRALGIDEVVHVDFYRNKYESGVFLLCSDGLYNYIDESDIIKFIIQYDDIENCLNQLIAKANENSGGDNITAVIIKP